MAYYSGSYFEVDLSGTGPPIKGQFTSVSGLGMEVEYEIYNEGGSSYPRFFFKEPKPQILVLEQGIITDTDSASLLMGMVNSGMCIPLTGVITLKDNAGESVRKWSIVGAHLHKYVGPDLNSMQPVLAVTRLEFLYNGCF